MITCVPHFYQGCAAEIVDAVELDTVAMATAWPPGQGVIAVPCDSVEFDDWLFGNSD